jgi:glutamyl/glutaminyl-tRNA synthetase
MNGRYLREMAPEELTERLEALTGRSGLRDVVAISQEKMSTLDEFWPLAQSFFDGPVDDPKAREKIMGKAGASDNLRAVREALAGVPAPWTQEAVEQALGDVIERTGAKAGQVYQPLRVAITGTTVSPGIFETVAVMGRDTVLERVDAALRG